MTAKAFRSDGGVRLLATAAAGSAGTASNPVIWADNTTLPNPRFGDGTADRYVPAITPTTVGDVAIWNGTNWIRSSAAGGQIGTLRLTCPRQTINAAASLTIDTSLGRWINIVLSATAITSLTISGGVDGELITVSVVQDATGGRTIPTTWTNVRFAGGSYTATATASRRDIIEFIYHSGAALWFQRSAASMNMLP